MNYIQQLSKYIEDQAIHVHKTAKIVDQKRHQLISIMQKHKTLKKIKYKERLAYQQKLLQDQRKLMDEIASIRHARKV
jgi:flagellar export protein FliJ